MAKSNGVETHVVVCNRDDRFEQLTDDDVTYRYKVLSIQEVSRDALVKTTFSEGFLPTRLKNEQGNTYVLASLKPALWPVSIAIYFFRNDIL